jgi:hypothetical protein
MKPKPITPESLEGEPELKSLSPVYGRQEISKPGRLAMKYVLPG